MKKKMFGKSLVLGLVFLIVIAGITPVIGMSMFTSKENSAAVPSDANSLADEEEKSSNMMTVTVVKLCNDNSIRSVREKISVKEYNEYAEKIETSESLEETFAVLREYDIVPGYMDLDSFKEIIYRKVNRFLLLAKGFQNLPKSHPLKLDFLVKCYFTSVIFSINPIVTNFYIPNIFLWANSENGGSIQACEELKATSRYFEVQDMFLYLGKLDMAPFIDFDGASFTGFAVYIDVYGLD